MTDYSLKRHYTGECARRIAEMLNHTEDLIDAEDYASAVDARIGDLELKDRVLVLAEELRHRLPEDYPTAIGLITDSLGPELREEQGMFTESWYLMPVARFVEEYGIQHPDASLHSLNLITRVHTGEFAIRPYLHHHQALTMKYVEEWARSDSHNVRRLASEGIRPRLPWHSRFEPFIQDPAPVIDIIDLLVEDPSKYVRTSVANNLNDIAKDHPDLAIATAKRWLARAEDTDRARWVVNRGLRTLVKAGHPDALAVVGAAPDPNISVTDVVLDTTCPHIDDGMRITATVTNAGDETRDVLIDYQVHFRRSDGSLRPTTFKLTRVRVEPGATATVSKRHSFKVIKTRTYYPGEHALTVQANGTATEPIPFTLV